MFAYGAPSLFTHRKHHMIFPQLMPEYADEKDRPLLYRMTDFYSESITLNQSFWAEADIDNRFISGEVNLWSELYPNVPANRRRLFNFNRIRRVINMISGHQRRTRKSMIAVPIENADDMTADQFTKVLMHVAHQDGILETISDAFYGSLTTGMTLLEVWNDFRKDPVSGTLRVNKCEYNEFLIDPYFRKPDLSDCRGIWKRSYMTKREIISLMPDKEDEIMSIMVNAAAPSKDAKFQYMPENYGWSYKNLMAYDEFHYQDFRQQKLLVDSQTGETTEWRSQDEDRLKEFLRTYPQVTVIETTIPTVKVGIVVQGRVLYDGPNTLGIDRYPFCPVLTYYNPQSPYYYLRIQGVVRGLRDAQYLYSRRKVIELDILESQINSGWIYKENALVNPKDVFLSNQGRGLALKDSALMTDVMQIPAPQIPPSMFQLSEGLANEINQISGVNEELLGSAMDDKAGVLSMLRQGAGLTTLQPLFDQLDQSQKLLGRILIEAVQTNYTPGKIQKILKEQPSDQFYNKAFGIYDCVVEDGLNTATQKQMEFAQLLQLRELGVPIPDESLVESATLQNKKKLIEIMQKNQQQQQQMQQMQMQAAIQEQQARTELAQARAVADQGLGVERMSRVQENQALATERKAQAERDHYASLLDFVKALKELEGIDIANLGNLISLAKGLSMESERGVQHNPAQRAPQRAPANTQEKSLDVLQGLAPA